MTGSRDREHETSSEAVSLSLPPSAVAAGERAQRKPPGQPVLYSQEEIKGVT